MISVLSSLVFVLASIEPFHPESQTNGKESLHFPPASFMSVTNNDEQTNKKQSNSWEVLFNSLNCINRYERWRYDCVHPFAFRFHFVQWIKTSHIRRFDWNFRVDKHYRSVTWIETRRMVWEDTSSFDSALYLLLWVLLGTSRILFSKEPNLPAMATCTLPCECQNDFLVLPFVVLHFGRRLPSIWT
jgi:hypothetical protein